MEPNAAFASLKSTYAMAVDKMGSETEDPFSSLKVFQTKKVLFGWLWTVWARISAYWDNGITPPDRSKTADYS